jgi:hypothetical protein
MGGGLMLRLLSYIGRFQGLRGSVGGMPGWARVLLLMVALPGIVLMGLSILVFLVSLLALLLLTLPVYRVLMAVTGSAKLLDEMQEQAPEIMMSPENTTVSPGRRHVDVKIIEETQG